MKAFYLGLILLCSFQAQALPSIWVGLVNKDWNVSGNWAFNSIPGKNDDVTIPKGVSKMPRITSEVNIRSLTLEENTVLEILPGGVLNIKGASGPGVVVAGILTNKGQLSINGTLGAGLIVEKSGEAWLQGDTYIGDAGDIGGNGISAKGHLRLVADLILKKDLTPSLTIDNTTGNGIHCDDCTMEMLEAVSGATTAIAFLNIGAAGDASIGANGILNEGTMDLAAGNVQIENTVADGVKNATTLPHFGRLTIGSKTNLHLESTGKPGQGDGLTNNEAGEIFNSGNIAIFKPGRYGLVNYQSFHNQQNGNIIVEDPKVDGIYNGIGEFENNGNIDIGGNSTGAMQGIRNNSALRNLTTGHIYISRTMDKGIYNEKDGFIENMGMISLGGSSTRKIGDAGIWNEGFIHNNTGGHLGINNSGFTGIVNEGGFRNEGEITIGASVSVGNSGIESYGQFDNLAQGAIHIMRAKGLGIQVFSEVFSNDGLINIGENGSVGFEAIRVEANGSFTNNSCKATVNIFSGGIADAANVITNDGLIIQKSAASSTIGTNNGVVLFIESGTVTVGAGNQPAALDAGIFDAGLWIGCAGTQWSDPENWYGDKLPTSDVVVTITAAGHRAEIAADSTANCKSLDLESGAVLDNAGRLIVTDGALWIKEEATLQGASGQYEISGNLVNQGSFDDPSASVKISGGGNNSVSGNAVAVNNFEVDKSSGTASAATDLMVANRFSLIAGNFEIALGGSLSAGEVKLQDHTTMTNNDSLFIDIAGKLLIESGATLQGNGLYVLGGNLTNDGAFQTGVSEVRFIGPAAISSLTGLSNTEFYDLLLDKGSGELHAIADFTVQNQLTLRDGTLYVPDHSTITLRDLSIETEGRISGGGTLTLAGNWINDGGFPSNQGSTVRFTGDSASEIGGSKKTSFFNLGVDKTDKHLVLANDIAVKNNLDLTKGLFDLNGYKLELPGDGTILGESAESYILDTQARGEIIKTLTLDAPQAVNPGNIGVGITTSANMGTTTIRRKHAILSINDTDGILRYYDIQPEHNSGLNAIIQLYYLDHELNGIAENELAPYQIDTTGWIKYIAHGKNYFDNWLEFSGVHSLQRLTLAPKDIVSAVHDPDLGRQMKVFPNPARSQANLQLPDGIGRAFVEITDLGGRRLFSTVTDGRQSRLAIDVHHWPAGIYLVRLQVDGRFFTKKLIVAGI